MMMVLMHKNNKVCDIDTGEVFNIDFMPYSIRYGGDNLKDGLIYKWLAKRAIPINRKNSDKLYRAAGLGRVGNERKLLELTHGLSINDNYWIKDSSQHISWEDVNLFNNKLSETLGELAFTGTGPATFTGDELSPEFTGQGTYAKCFVRKEDGIYLYKQGTAFEVTSEIMAAFTARLLRINHIEYKYEKLHGIDASVCKIYTNESISWESAFNFTTYTENQYNKNVYDYIKDTFPLDFYKMVLLDGLVLNSDRHLQNWSMNLRGDTNELIGVAPNYDFNRAFTGKSTDMSPFIEGLNLLEAARKANRILGLDLVTILVPHLSKYPPQFYESLYNRVLYISGIKTNQNNCY